MATDTHERGKRVRGKRGQEGINVRHRLNCSSGSGGGCSCQPAYQAQAWSALEGKQIRKTFPSLSDAKAWRQNTQVGLRQGTVRAPSPTTLNQAASEWLAAACTGVVRTRSGDPYKPSAIRSYQHSLNSHILPRLGSQRLTAISHLMLQDLADQMVATGLSASTIRNAILPLRAIYRRAHTRNDVAVNLSPPGFRGGSVKSGRAQSSFSASARRVAAAAAQALPAARRAEHRIDRRGYSRDAPRFTLTSHAISGGPTCRTPTSS